MNSFFLFWMQKWRVTVLLVVLLVIMGVGALIAIPKESSPSIDFGVIVVTTAYPGASPDDVDDSITQDIESAIEDIDDIDKIETTSQLGLSTVTVTLTTDADIEKILSDIKNDVDTVRLPEDASDPTVTEIETDTERMFDVVLYTPSVQFSQEDLFDKGALIQQRLESQSFIGGVSSTHSLHYDVDIVLDKNTADIVGVTPASVASVVRSSTSSTPLGNYSINTTTYDYSIDKITHQIDDIMQLPLVVGDGSVVVEDVAQVVRDYRSDVYTSLVTDQRHGYHYITLTVSKTSGASIFAASRDAKEYIEQLLTDDIFEGISFLYANDVAETIGDDYRSVTMNGLTTLALVFLAVFVFVGLKESIMATLSIPLAFFVTFLVLNYLGLSLNFLTNFSLIVTFGIAIDTIIVIIEAATEKHKLGYTARNAALLAVNEFKRPLIAGTATTCVVFIPLFVLPGVMGKFLSYIPITIFITLIAALVLSLIVNPVLYYLLTPKSKTYERHLSEEEVMDDEMSTLLAEDRVNKQEITHPDGWRHRLFGSVGDWYQGVMSRLLATTISKRRLFWGPVLAVFGSFLILGSQLGFTLFPSGDNPNMTFVIEAPVGSTQDVFADMYDRVDDILADVPEIKLAYYAVNTNTRTINIELYKQSERDEYGGRLAFEIEEQLLDQLSFVQQSGRTLESAVQSGGPPASAPVGVKLMADTRDDFDAMVAVAKDLDAYLQTIDGTKNVGYSAESTPGLFSFQFDMGALQVLGLTPSQVTQVLYTSLYGVDAGSLAGVIDDRDIRVVYDVYQEDVTPQGVGDVVIQTPRGAVAVRDILSYDLIESVASYQREDGRLVVRIDSDIEQGVPSSAIQAQFMEYVQEYDFPDGVSYSAGGEASENADLIAAMGTGAVIAMFLIYGILVLQFNSLKQPIFIMYSIFVSLLGVNIGLWATGNPYSLSFMIGFIALMGIVVNDAIVLIDRINYNVSRGMGQYQAVMEAGKSRLQPILLTTITTIVGLTSIATQDAFFAGLAYTIMFGLFVGSAATLFVVPAMYLMWVKK